MSLFGTLQMSSNALQVDQILMQVVSQNIANSQTEGYVREKALLSTAYVQRVGNLTLGTGVSVDGIVQVIDTFLQKRLNSATSEEASTATTNNTYTELQQTMNSLGDTGLNNTMTTFFNSINDILNAPEDLSTRNMAVLYGETLTGQINELSTQVTQTRTDLNTQVALMGDSINSLLTNIADLNVQIAATEAGTGGSSQAVGLRDQRDQYLTELATMVNIKTNEQDNGEVLVYCDGNIMVSQGTAYPVKVTYEADSRGLPLATIRMAQTDVVLTPDSGQLAGLTESRDTVLEEFLNDLDSFSQSLIYEFNKVYASGQGLTGYDSVTGEYPVDSANASLGNAGLTYTPTTGSFNIQVYNSSTNSTTTTTINIDLTGLGHDTTLSNVAEQINSQLSGVGATVDANNILNIASTSSDVTFSFANDTSGVLAALGINTFFTGTSASSIGVNQQLQDDPSKFAASAGGVAVDTDNAVTLANFITAPLATQAGASISTLYDNLVNSVSQNAAVANAQYTASLVYRQTLQSQRDSISGVSVDEETVNMLAIQRAYQASAKVISVVNDLFDTLLNL